MSAFLDWFATSPGARLAPEPGEGLLDATDPARRPDPTLFVEGLARCLADLWALRPDGCPEVDIEARTRPVIEAVRSGMVLDPPYERARRETVIAQLEQPPDLAGPRVVTHGSLRLERIWVAKGAAVGFSGWDRAGSAPIEIDLAGAVGSLGIEYGGEAVAALLDATGVSPPSPMVLDWCALLVGLERSLDAR